MAGKAVTQQSTVSLRGANQIEATGYKDAVDEVVPEELVTKDLAEEEDASTAHHTHHR